jgi:hypothetical protein
VLNKTLNPACIPARIWKAELEFQEKEAVQFLNSARSLAESFLTQNPL